MPVQTFPDVDEEQESGSQVNRSRSTKDFFAGVLGLDPVSQQGLFGGGQRDAAAKSKILPTKDVAMSAFPGGSMLGAAKSVANLKDPVKAAGSLGLSTVAPGLNVARNVADLPDAGVQLLGSITGSLTGAKGGLSGEIVGSALGSGAGRLAIRGREYLLGEGRGAEQPFSETLKEAGQDFKTDLAFGLATPFGMRAARSGFKVAKQAITAYKGLRKFKTSAARAGFVQKLRKSYLGSIKRAGGEFEGQIKELEAASPGKLVDIVDSSGAFRGAFENPAFGEVLERTIKSSKNPKKMAQLVREFESGEPMTMSQLQEVKNLFGSMFRRRLNSTSMNLSGADMEALEVWHRIRSAQIGTFEEFADISADYAEDILAFKEVKSALAKGGTLESAIKGRGQDSDVFIEATKRLLPDDMIQELAKFEAQANARKTAGKLVRGAAKTAFNVGVAGGAAKMLFGDFGRDSGQ